MTADPHWARVERLFNEADALPETKQDAFLRKACGDDAGLRHEVDSLLRAARRPDDPLAVAVERSFEDALRPPSDFAERWLGREVGAYRIVRELGRGGMGVVFQAAHREFGRNVAIKFVHSSLFDASAMERFESERRILANLDHPGIARFIDAGTSIEHTPYLVMEYVEGESITSYCRERNKTVVEAVELIRQVCAAVQHAHRNLVIHRDLKPSNILVDSKGAPKLLDFGIAKLLVGDSDPPSSLTRQGVHPLTPEYASPEQARGEPLTTQADVYSLGVVLYELLTGKLPFPAHSLPWSGPRSTTSNPPIRPSTASERRRGMNGDLDNIVLKAMHEDVTQRYGSAEELSEDLGRFLQGRPVRARRDTATYRFRRFVGRHRVAVGLSAAMTLAAFGFVLSQLETRRAELLAVNVTGAIQSNLRGTLRERGATVTSIELLDWSEGRAKAAANEEVGQTAPLSATVAVILEKALQVHRLWRGDRHPSSLNLLVTLARLQQGRGEYAKAEGLYLEHLVLLRKDLGSEDPEIVLALSRLASVMHERGTLKAAEAVYREAAALSRKILGERHLTTAVTLNNLAGVLEDQGALREAEALCREALETRRQAFGPEHAHVARGLHNLGLTLLAQGRMQAGEGYLKEALEMRERAHGDNHPIIGESLAALGASASQGRDFAAAERHYRRAVAVLSRTLAYGHPTTAGALVGLGEALLDQGKAQAAEPLLREALTMLRMGPRASGPERARAEVVLGSLLIARREKEAGRTLIAEGLARVERLGAEHPLARTLRAFAQGHGVSP